ncbi:peptidoglycan-binding protein [Streptomyces sp. NPDC002889]|uniref:peptidoglycan-binding protein n=1 Tax=Streptomyces sp. NPDC002889 TaxID=3364669 RepID=UPI0036B2442F
MSASQTLEEEEAAAAGPSEDKVARPRPRRRGRTVAITLAVLVAAGVGVVIADPFGARPKDTTIASSVPTGLAKVTKGTLSARTLENGTLGYAGDYQVVNKASGTVTKLPGVGQVIKQGKVLYRVDGKPVILLHGAYVPVYRALSWGTEGADVKQLNAALVALGYATKDELDPDSDYFGRQTYNALVELQDDVGLEETGDLPLGQAVFLPAKEIRVTKVTAVPGGTVAGGASVMQASSTDREVTVELSASQQADVAVGDKVTITLPTDKTTEGVVSVVGKVATKGTSSTTIDVRIRPLKPKETGQLDQAPVQVSIVTETVKDVLSVPVNSLLALAGGGYAVEVVEDAGDHRLVAVKPGLFDDAAGKVEVTGTGLTVNQSIVVPSS